MEDDELARRLELVRGRVRGQSAEVRRLRRKAKEGQARASSVAERAATAALRARGHPCCEPPVPTHVPSWLDESDPL